MKFSLFRRTQHKTFQHIPIYYDEREVRLKEMEEGAKAEAKREAEKSADTSTDYHDRIKGSMRRFETNHQTAAVMASKEKKRSNMRIIIILAILFLVAYVLWHHTDTFIEAFLKH